MTINEAVRERILGLCQEKAIPLNHLAARCGLPPAAVNKVIRADASADINFIHAVCNGLGLSISSFFAAPIFQKF